MVLIAIGVGALGLAGGFFAQTPWATSLWPWTGSRLSFIFIASILAASALPVIWIGWSGEFAAVTGGALNLCVSYAAMGAFAFDRHAHDPSRRAALLFASACVVAALASLLLMVWARRLPFRDQRPTPQVVRASFAIFFLVLLAVGGALVAQRQVFPWRLDGEQAALYGFVFLGAACYFLYGLLRPVWGNAQGQLLGFLAYDLVLIVPFWQHLGRVDPALRLNLMVYLAVLVYSGVLAAAGLWRMRARHAAGFSMPR